MLREENQMETVEASEDLPLLIKQYRHNSASFTNQLYEQLHTPVSIRGLRGRGLCLDLLPSGDVVFIAGGTGLFPFLDLIDLMFKFVAAQKARNLM